jgi:magnesium transporter
MSMPQNHSDALSHIKEAIESGDIDTVSEMLEVLHAADKAELLNNLSEDDRVELIAMMGDRFDHDILPELHPDVAGEVIEALGVDRSAEALAQLETDDAVAVMEELTDAEKYSLLQAVPEELRTELQEGLTHPEDSAGRLMTKKLVCVPEFWSVGDAIDYLRGHADPPENFYVVYVVDPRFHPIGYVPLGRIMRSRRDMKIRDIAIFETYSVHTDTDQEEVAHMFTKYGLVEAPVVNRGERLVGTITVDDVVHVIHEEEEEDYLRAGGIMAQDIQAGIPEAVRQRFTWLFINLLTAVLASVVIGFYTDTIRQFVALAVLMPIVASMGGNAGIQSVTVVVRALATRQLRQGNMFAVIRKELLIGFINGVGLAAVMGGGAWLWYHDIELAGIFAAATIIALTTAGVSGAAIPILLSKFKVDPALSSGIFLTTLTDVVGFLAFLGLASWMLV